MSNFSVPTGNTIAKETSSMRKYTKSIQQYRRQIDSMKEYLKDLEQRKYEPAPIKPV